MYEKILIIEDDVSLATLLQSKLERYLYEVVCSRGDDDVLSSASKEVPSLILLDINLPKFDGFYWCRKLREVTRCPIIFISARDSELDQVMALENGGDDYMTKPFATDVLVAKVRSHLRRAYGEYSQSGEEEKLEAEGLTLDCERLELYYGTECALLSNKERQLFELLVGNYGAVVKRQDILSALWDNEHFIDENTLNVNISRARRQLERIGAPHKVTTVRGLGYRLFAEKVER